MPNLIKKLVTAEYTPAFENAGGMLIVSMSGLTVAETEALRGTLDNGELQFRMVKNSLAKRVLHDTGYEVGDDVLAGNIAIAWGSAESAIHAAKVVQDSPMRKDGKLTVRAGVLEGSLLSEADAKALADIPDQDSLRASLVGLLQGPARGIASMLSAVPGSVARVLDAHAASGAEGDAEA